MADTGMHDAQSLLRATLESTTDGILVVNREGRIVLHNRRFAEMWRIPVMVLDKGDDQAALAWVLDQLREPETFLAKVRELYADASASSYDVLYFKDGRVFERYSRPQQMDNRTVGRVWSFRDVTEHRLAESALRESERRSRALLENSTEGIVTFGADGSILWANPSAGVMLGMHLHQVRGQPFQQFVHQDDRPQVDRLWHGTLKEAGAQVPMRARVQRSDGSYVVLDGTFTNLLHEPGLHAVVVHFRDITESLALQEQLAQAQKLDAIGRLAGGVAHDFNNLLTAIIGHAELLKDAVPDGSEAREDVAEIEQAAARATALTQQLLAFSRRQVLQPAVLDPNAVVDGLRRMVERLIPEHIRREFRLQASGRVKADRTQLEQVLLNLLLNARDAMPRGGVLLVETSDRELDEWYVRRHQGASPGWHVCLTVSDTGTGMDRATLERVFEPFFSTKPNGTGLGLSTVYGIVKQSGGHILVESEPGHGTVFTVYLPRVDEPAAVAPASRNGERPDGTETILLVEDEQVVRDLATKVLRQRGYTVLDADGGPAAFVAAGAHHGPIHLVLADVVMPDMSGPAVAERLASSRPEAKVLYMSGYADESIIEEGMLSRSAPFLPKPFTPAELARKVREVLDS